MGAGVDVVEKVGLLVGVGCPRRVAVVSVLVCERDMTLLSRMDNTTTHSPERLAEAIETRLGRSKFEGA